MEWWQDALGYYTKIEAQKIRKEVEKLMSNQSEWETVEGERTIAEHITTYHIHDDDRYEYRLQRRKKEKPMPGLERGDAFSVYPEGGDWVIFMEYLRDSNKIIAYNCQGMRLGYCAYEITRIRRNGTEIWRRGGS
jgi:hypothetical protein